MALNVLSYLPGLNRQPSSVFADTAAMAAVASRWRLSTFYEPKRAFSPLPDFLIPAFSYTSASRSRSFSTSLPRASRVGAAPIGLPEGVNIQVIEPPKRKGVVTRVEPPKTIAIEGPLGTYGQIEALMQMVTNFGQGKASVSLPPFLSFAVNGKTRKAALSVQDRKIRKQREMWGELSCSL